MIQRIYNAMRVCPMFSWPRAVSVARRLLRRLCLFYTWGRVPRTVWRSCTGWRTQTAARWFLEIDRGDYRSDFKHLFADVYHILVHYLLRSYKCQTSFILKKFNTTVVHMFISHQGGKYVLLLYPRSHNLWHWYSHIQENLVLYNDKDTITKI